MGKFSFISWQHSHKSANIHWMLTMCLIQYRAKHQLFAYTDCPQNSRTIIFLVEIGRKLFFQIAQIKVNRPSWEPIHFDDIMKNILCNFQVIYRFRDMKHRCPHHCPLLKKGKSILFACILSS